MIEKIINNNYNSLKKTLLTGIVLSGVIYSGCSKPLLDNPKEYSSQSKIISKDYNSKKVEEESKLEKIEDKEESEITLIQKDLKKSYNTIFKSFYEVIIKPFEIISQ